VRLFKRLIRLLKRHAALGCRQQALCFYAHSEG
jgi:hypothetical protein